ncbi:exosortase family protein XrtF [Flavobacteriaceae bacterium MAR_2010_105]|nr:exosortase family protein XrtF [Flavobacteriaceae bacterium MAR_2010_105]
MVKVLKRPAINTFNLHKFNLINRSLKTLLKTYKSVIKFILTFLLAYLLLSIGYKFYLDLSQGSKYYPDYLTQLVAKQSKQLINVIGYSADIQNHPNEASIKLIIHGKYVARVVEGCNSISVIILFVSFMLAFAGRAKPTALFIFAGSVLIYAVNLIRIVILSVGLYHYPWRREILHTVIFPLIIYGLVFMLWMIWVNRFSKLKKQHG